MNIFKHTYISNIDENFQIQQNKILFINNKRKKNKIKNTSEEYNNILMHIFQN